jgi:GntR family transcriptional regulator, transcriptional repressor for pyruvate dehydrogenase complex
VVVTPGVMNTPFAPVQRRTISSEIRAQLLEAIRTGELQPGSPVPAERQLCEQFGVARTSVREAIQGLTASGYLERRGNRPVVAERLPEIRLSGDSATLDERKALIRQLFEVRRTIEPTMSEFAARRATTEERADIAALAARSSVDLDEFRSIDRAFHTAISRACGNPMLQEVYGKTLGALFDSGELASLLYAEINRREVADIIASSTAAHRAIAEALVAGRRKATIGAVQAHLDDVERRMIDRLL